MKNLILFLLLQAPMTTCIAQGPDTAISVITYAFSHIRDTTNAAKPYSENMDLFLGKKGSVYKSADKKWIDSVTMETFKASGGTSMSPPRLYTQSQLYFYNDVHQYYASEKFFGNFLVTDEWPKINWKITDATKKIAELKCQKALGEWRGRTYEAWFCPDLPYTSGPWKLNGLPGLIIEASDVKKQVVFKFAGFKTIKDKQTVIALPAKNTVTQTTAAEFEKLRNAGRKNPGAVANAAMNGSGAKILSTTPSTVKNEVNNPLELVKL